LSLQSSAFPLVQLPPWQASWPSHRSESAHDVPFARLGKLHTPALHRADLHGSLVVHAVHAAPPAPHAPALVPGWQLDPFQHPVQHAPVKHLPPVHPVPSTTGA
jgi:hypothetical protein